MLWNAGPELARGQPGHDAEVLVVRGGRAGRSSRGLRQGHRVRGVGPEPAKVVRERHADGILGRVLRHASSLILVGQSRDQPEIAISDRRGLRIRPARADESGD